MKNNIGIDNRVFVREARKAFLAIDAVVKPESDRSRTNYHKALESLLDAGVIEAKDELQ